jgi:cyclopropane fatty-acyl-phospholipid synthase-like methyltransferase
MSQNTIYENGIYFEKNPTWHEEDSPWKAKQIVKILKKNNIAPSSICEVGCGAGEILNCLTNEYDDNKVTFSGYDISPQAFSICSKKERKNLNFFLKDLFDEEQLKFDVTMAIDVFEHIEDYFSFLRKLKVKGSYKVFHIPLDLSVQTVLRGKTIANARSLYGHIHYFTKEIALASLRDTGYEVVDYFYTNSLLELPNLSVQARLMKLPRKLLFSIHQDLTVRVLGGFSLLVLAK